VDLSSGTPVISLDVSNGRATGVTTNKTSYPAAKVVNCAGAWAGQIPPYDFPTRPVKGQMVCFVMPSRDLLRHVIRAPEIYLIPRSDGRLLAGATVEEAGFDKRTVPDTIQQLSRAAVAMLPDLKDARSWKPGQACVPARPMICRSWERLPPRILCCNRTFSRRYFAGTRDRSNHGRCDGRREVGL